MGARGISVLVLLVAGACCILVWEDVFAPLFSSESPGRASDGTSLLFEEEEHRGKRPRGPALTAEGRVREARKRVGARETARQAGARPPPTPVEAMFRGRVRSVDGKAAPGIRITLVGEGRRFEVTTDAKGRFRQPVPPGRYQAVFWGGDSGVLLVPTLVIDPETGAARPLSYRLVEPASLEVTVLRLDDDPKDDKPPAVVPVSAAMIGLAHVEAELAIVERRTGAQGVAVFEQLLPGAYRLELEVLNGPRVSSLVTTTSGERATLELRVPESVVFKGKVTIGKSGAGVRGAQIDLALTSAISDTVFRTSFETAYDGSFEVPVPRGTIHAVQVQAEGYAVWPSEKNRAKVYKALEALRGKAPVILNIDLEGGTNVSGDVHSEVGTPLEGVTFRVTTATGHRIESTTDEVGAYLLANIPAGDHRIEIVSTGWYFIKSEDSELAIDPGKGAILKDLDLREGRTFSGMALGEGEEPVGGARVWFVSGTTGLPIYRRGGGRYEAFSDGNGEWSIENVEPNIPVVVRAAVGPRQSPPLSIESLDGDLDHVDLRLQGTGGLRGTVIDLRSTQPIKGASVRLEPAEPDGRTVVSVLTGEDGAYHLDGVMPGAWLLRTTRSDYLRSAAEIEIRAGEPETRQIVLNPGLAYGGLCVDEAGKPLPWAQIVFFLARNPDGRHWTTHGNAAGEFHLGGLNPGEEHKISVALDGYETTTITAPPGGDARMRIPLKKAK